MKYLGYLEEAYVIRRVPQYSMKAKRELSYYMKLYNEDVAFNTIRQHSGHYDLTHNLENIVYNELIYMGYNLSVFNKNGLEIDFLAEKKDDRTISKWRTVLWTKALTKGNLHCLIRLISLTKFF